VAELTCALGPDTAGTLITAFLEEESERVEAAVYDVSRDFAWCFARAADRGAAVRLLLDPSTPGVPETVAEIGGHERIDVRTLRRTAHLEGHWKVLTCGEDGIALGTGNLTGHEAPRDSRHRLPPPRSAARPGTREWWILARGLPAIVTSARARIGLAWARASTPMALSRDAIPEKPPLYGVPRPLVPPLTLDVDPAALDTAYTGAALRAMAGEMLGGASRRALLTVPYVNASAPEVGGLLHLLDGLRGVDTRILLGSPGALSDAEAMVRMGIEVRVMNRQRCTLGHAKGIIVDGSVLVMSADFSHAGLSTHLQAGMRIDVPAAADYFADCVERDWETADEAGG